MQDKPKRLLSIDTLRGLDMLIIMGLSTLIVRICELFPGGSEFWIAQQMHHASWNGLTIMDMVFPVFLFVAGLSFPFSYASQVGRGLTSRQIHRKIFVRCLVLVVLGIVYNGFFDLSFPQRYASVLGRIGLAWMFAALLYIHCKPKVRIGIAAGLLVVYGLLIALVKAPDAPAGFGPLTLEGCLNGYVDRLLLPGRLHYGSCDPEGLLGVVPATVTAMLGMFTGEFVRLPEEKMCGGRKTLWMFGAAAALLAVGLLLSPVLPLNKKLWTSSYVLVVGAISLAVYALIYYLVEVKGWQRWTFPFRVIGLNSITIYLWQRIVPMKEVTNFFFGGAAGLLPEAWGAVLLAAGYVVLCWLLLYFLWRKKIFLKV
jgi:predicted acyltransferase